MTHELMPCPFCGGNAELDTMRAFRNMSTKQIESEAAVYCLTCEASISFCYSDAPGVHEDDIIMDAVMSWNTRTDESIIEHENKRLRDALELICMMHDGNPPMALADMSDLDYARRTISNMRKEARDALSA